MRAVWISYSEMSDFCRDASGEVFGFRVSEAFSALADDGITAVIVHARAFADSFYPSELFPWSAYITGTQGESPGYDPLGIMLSRAHAAGLELHAWFNPFRVSSRPSLDGVSDGNPALRLLGDSDETNDSLVYFGEGEVYFNPSSREVHALVIEGIRECAGLYDIDGVHIDDYFYPTVSEDIDRAEYAEYLAGGGTLSLGDWRRGCVSAFVSGMYSAVKSERPGAVVSISPGGDIDKNYSELYADVREWSECPGYCDVLMPQLYYGFEHGTMPFAEVCARWEALAAGGAVRLVPGLAAYKSGREDAYARGGSREWTLNSDILARQREHLRSMPGYAGYALFSYSYLYADNANDTARLELKNLNNAPGVAD